MDSEEPANMPAMQSLDPADWSDLRALGHRMIDDMFDHLHTLRDGPVDLPLAHTAAGNPSRFDTGRTAISTDAAWQTEMPSLDRRLVTALTAPGLLGYRYPVRDHAGRPG